jgi:hypothetical protein
MLGETRLPDKRFLAAASNVPATPSCFFRYFIRGQLAAQRETHRFGGMGFRLGRYTPAPALVRTESE